jgi:hypothetical protein
MESPWWLNSYVCALVQMSRILSSAGMVKCFPVTSPKSGQLKAELASEFLGHQFYHILSISHITKATPYLRRKELDCQRKE